MKKHYLTLIIGILSFISCTNDSEDLKSINSDTKWWILVHPTSGNQGIYLYNETKSLVEKILPLPDPNGSPHALGFDGNSLWLGGALTNTENATLSYNPIYELNPENGEILSTIDNINTQGIAATENYIYYSNYSEIIKIKKDGTFVESIFKGNSIMNDIAFDNSKFYYVSNGPIDPIIKINPTNSIEETIVETEVTALNTLTIHNDNLIVITDSNEIRRFDINTGQKISDTETIIDGWITAIVPYKKESEQKLHTTSVKRK